MSCGTFSDLRKCWDICLYAKEKLLMLRTLYENCNSIQVHMQAIIIHMQLECIIHQSAPFETVLLYIDNEVYVQKYKTFGLHLRLRQS